MKNPVSVPRWFGDRLSVCGQGILLVVGLALRVNAAESEPPTAFVASAPAEAAPDAPAQRPAAELEKLAMPIALHPDPLISIILPAAAYPVEIVQAARFVEDTNNLPRVDYQPWDENVKSVARFPELIAEMNANLEWTANLGQAFIEQPKELMDAIQALRLKAYEAGTLRSTRQQEVTVTNMVVVETNLSGVVTVTNEIMEVEPSDPEVVYVPSYPPAVYYPPPGYIYDPSAPPVGFGIGIVLAVIIANHCDWNGGGVYVDHRGKVDIDVNSRNVNRNVSADRGKRPAPADAQKWRPDQDRIRNSGAASPAAREARGWGDTAGASAGRVGTRPAPSANFRSPGVSAPRPSGGGGSAFSGAGSSGAATRSMSSRGAGSMGGGFGGGGFRGGGGGGRR